MELFVTRTNYTVQPDFVPDGVCLGGSLGIISIFIPRSGILKVSVGLMVQMGKFLLQFKENNSRPLRFAHRLANVIEG